MTAFPLCEEFSITIMPMTNPQSGSQSPAGESRTKEEEKQPRQSPCTSAPNPDPSMVSSDLTKRGVVGTGYAGSAPRTVAGVVNDTEDIVDKDNSMFGGDQNGENGAKAKFTQAIAGDVSTQAEDAKQSWPQHDETAAPIKLKNNNDHTKVEKDINTEDVKASCNDEAQDKAQDITEESQKAADSDLGKDEDTGEENKDETEYMLTQSPEPISEGDNKDVPCMRMSPAATRRQLTPQQVRLEKMRQGR